MEMGRQTRQLLIMELQFLWECKEMEKRKKESFVSKGREVYIWLGRE